MVIAATDDTDVNIAVFARRGAAGDARERGRRAAAVQLHPAGESCAPAHWPSAISTAGASPALAKRMKREIEGQFGEPYARLAVLLNEVRGWAKGTLPTYQERRSSRGDRQRRPRPGGAAARRQHRRGHGRAGGARADRAGAERAHAAGVESLSVAVLEVEGLARHYGELEALADVSLSLNTGETLVVFRPNGAGKKHLLRVLATLPAPACRPACACSVEPPAGRVVGAGRIGLLAHEPLLYRELTAREEPALPRAPSRRRRRARRAPAGSCGDDSPRG